MKTDLDRITLFGIITLAIAPFFVIRIFNFLGDNWADFYFVFYFFSIPISLSMYFFYWLRHRVTTNEVVGKISLFLYRLMQISLLITWIVIIFNVINELNRYHAIQYFDVSFLMGG